MPIVRGGTPTVVFNVAIDLTTAVVLYVSYYQNNRKVLEKPLEECTVTEKTVTNKLSQAETLKFREEYDVEMQIRARLEDGSAPISKVITTTVSRLLKPGVI